MSAKFKNLSLALYCASIIIGAGVLTLPSSAAQLGFVPLLVAIVAIGFYMMIIYHRFTFSLFAYLRRYSSRVAKTVKMGLAVAGGVSTELPQGKLDDENQIIADEVSARGSRQLAELVQESGLGQAGKTSLVVGMFIYVFFAVIGYLAIGSTVLAAIAFSVPRGSGLWFLGGGLLMLILGLNLEGIFSKPFLLRGTLKKTSVMLGVWLIGIGILAWLTLPFQQAVHTHFDQLPVWLVVINILLFAISVISGMLVKQKNSKQDSELSDHQRVNVVIMIVNLVLVLLTALLVLVFALNHHLFIPFYAFGDAFLHFNLNNAVVWANMIGLILFAYVGTGLFNLCRHPAIFERQGKYRVPRLVNIVILGTAIPMLVYLGWTMVTALVLPASDLSSMAAAAADFSTVRIASLFSNYDSAGAIPISIFGYLFALLAVTTACNGFTESLSDQLSVALDKVKKLHWITRTQEGMGMRMAILFAAVIVTIGVKTFRGINLLDILSIAGNAGGGLLLLILPYFLPTRGQQKTTRQSVMMAMMSAVVLFLLLVTASKLWVSTDIGSILLGVANLVMAACILAISLWLLRSKS